MSRPHTIRIDAFRAIAHPARRRTLELLAEGERSVNELAAHFEMTLPAYSQHLRVLRRAQLVRQRRVGRGRLYQLNAKAFKEIKQWIARMPGRTS